MEFHKIRKALAVFLLTGLTAVYFAEALFFNEVLSFRDLSRYFFPLRFFTTLSMKSGILPLWNPHIFCGTPHLALQQSIIFYPLSIIYYLLPFDKAFNVFLVCHIALAGIFMYLAGLRWRLRSSSSLVAAITFMFSGYVISAMNLATTLSSIVWLPMILLFFDRGLSRDDTKDILITALFLGAMFFGGEPSIFYSTLWVLLFYAVFFWLNNKGALTVRRVAQHYFLAASVGVFLSALQLIPFLELARFADRTIGGAGYSQVTMWSMPLRDIISFVIPFLGRTDFSTESYWKEQNWAIVIYTGVFAALLVLMAILFRKDWKVRFLILLGLFFLLISFGSHTPFYRLLYNFIPGFRFVRYPVRFLYVTTFAIAMLSGMGFDAYIEGKNAQDERLIRFFKQLLFVLYASSLIFLALHMYKTDAMEAIRHIFCAKHLGSETKNAAALFSIAASIFNIGRFLGFFMGGGVLLFLGLKEKVGSPIISFAFISLVIIDLFSAEPGILTRLETAVFHKKTPNIEYLEKDKSFFRFFVSPKTREESYFLKGMTYESAIDIGKDRLTANWPILYGLYDASGYDSIRLVNYTKLITLVETSSSPSATRILDMLNVKYLIVSKEIDTEGYRLVNKSEAAYLYENMRVLPRAFLVGSFKVLRKEEDVASRFKSKEFDPAQEVILEEEPKSYIVPSISYIVKTKYDVRTTNDEKVEIVKYTPNEVVIKAVVNSPKFLVLSDSYYPGWKAYVDGTREKIYVANYALRAVYLNAGEHAVRFVFDPLSFKLGASLSITTLLFLALYIVIKKRYDII